MTALSEFNAYIVSLKKAEPRESNGQIQNDMHQDAQFAAPSPACNGVAAAPASATLATAGGSQAAPPAPAGEAIGDNVDVDGTPNPIFQRPTLRMGGGEMKGPPQSPREAGLRNSAREVSRQLDHARKVLGDHNEEQGRPRNAPPAENDRIGQALQRQIQDLERRLNELNEAIVLEKRRNLRKRKSNDPVDGGKSPTDAEEGTGGNKKPGGSGGEGGSAEGGKGQGAGGGHSQAGSGEGQGGEHGPSGGTPAKTETESAARIQKTHDTIQDFQSRVEKFQQKQADYDKREEAFEAQLENQNKAEDDSAELEKMEEQLSNEEAELRTEAESLLNEGEGLGKQLYEAAPEEFEHAFGTKNPKGMLEAARKGIAGILPKVAPHIQLAMKAANILGKAIFAAQIIENILESDNKLEAIGQGVVSYEIGSVENAIFAEIIGVEAAFIMGFVLNMSSDQGGDLGRRIEEQSTAQIRGRIQRNKENAEFLEAVVNYLDKYAPGTAARSGAGRGAGDTDADYNTQPGYVIYDVQTWNRTLKKLAELQKLHNLKESKSSSGR